MFKTVRAIGISLVVVCLLAGGCSRREQHVITKKGIIKSISLRDRTAQIVTDDKMGNKLEVSGQFTETTVVTINGKPAQFGDIRTGDSVEVSAYRKPKGDVFDFIATKVAVLRPTSSQPES